MSRLKTDVEKTLTPTTGMPYRAAVLCQIVGKIELSPRFFCLLNCQWSTPRASSPRWLAERNPAGPASVVGARYLAIGTGDTELYIFAGMLAAVVISVRVFLFRGAGKAN